jgi:hypothetical protein
VPLASRIDSVIADITDLRQTEGRSAAPPQRDHAATLNQRNPATPAGHAPCRARRTDHSGAYQWIIGLRRPPSQKYQTVPTDAAMACG